MTYVTPQTAVEADLCKEQKQQTMRFFALTFDRIVIRYYLMMAAVITGVFTGQFWIAVFALPLFLSAVLGVSFKAEKV